MTPFSSHTTSPFHCLCDLSLGDVVRIYLTDKNWNSRESKAGFASLGCEELGGLEMDSALNTAMAPCKKSP